MSQVNWQRMVEKKIAGDNSVTCFLAALDCLLDDEDVPYKVYAQYTQAYNDQCENGVDRRRTRQIFRTVLEHAIGSSCLKNFISKRAATPEDTVTILENARMGNKKVIIMVSEYHDVGLRPTSEGLWIMVGNGLPYDEELTSEEVFLFLYVPPRSGKKEEQTNIFLIS